MNHDDDRGADIITLPTFNLAPPGTDPDDDEVPGLPEPPSTAPPPEFTLPFHLPEDEEDSDEYDPDNAAGEMMADATNGTGTPTRATASMAMVTMAAIAVAAVRGTWSMAAYLKARREHHNTVADKARAAAGKQKLAGAEKAPRRVQSGPEFGRGAVKGGGRGASGGQGPAAGGRGAFGQKAGGGRRGSGSSGLGATGTGGKGPSGRGAKGSAGSAGGSGAGSGGAGSRGSGGGPSKRPGTLGQLALNRQKRRNDEAKAQRQAAAVEQKAGIADRTAARRQAEKIADERRKRKVEKRKAKLERGKDDAEKVDLTKEKDDGTTKVDLTKKPKAGDKGAPKKDPADSTSAGSKSGTAKKPRKPRRKKAPKKNRRTRGKHGPSTPGGKRRKGRGGSPDDIGSMPGGDGEWLRPPPGWDVSYTVTIEREPNGPANRRRPAAIDPPRKSLPPGRPGEVAPTRTPPKESPIVMGTAAAVSGVGDTQFVDADLTLYDLIDSDEEMGEQILAGVDHMRLVASKCDGLKAGLENLYATCLEKKVPGVLVNWCIRLIERGDSVQDKAEALAASLPRGSEAVLAARDTAIEVDRRRADAVKDAGHVAPAEREYHDRSGA